MTGAASCVLLNAKYGARTKQIRTLTRIVWTDEEEEKKLRCTLRHVVSSIRATWSALGSWDDSPAIVHNTSFTFQGFKSGCQQETTNTLDGRDLDSADSHHAKDAAVCLLHMLRNVAIHDGIGPFVACLTKLPI